MSITDTKQLAIISTAKELFAQGFRRNTFDVPEFGGRQVTVCELSPLDRVKAERLSEAVYTRGEESDKDGNPYPDPLAWIASRGLCHPESGELLLQEEEANNLGKNIGGAAVERIAREIQKLSQVERPTPVISNLAHTYLVVEAGMPSHMDGAEAYKWIQQNCKTKEGKELRDGVVGAELDDWISEHVSPRQPEKNSGSKRNRKEPLEEL